MKTFKSDYCDDVNLERLGKYVSKPISIFMPFLVKLKIP